MTVFYWLLLLHLDNINKVLYILLSHYTRCTLNRIVGGSKVPIEECAYQLSLRFNGQPICGAVLLNHYTALTAAHCIPKRGSYSVRAGSSNFYEGGVIAYVKRAIVHPGYNTNHLDHDIAILKLYEPLRYSRKIRPVRLPKQDEQLSSGIGFVSGWGSVSARYPFPAEELMGVKLPLVPMSACKKSYGYRFGITSTVFCAGFLRGGKDACHGDSGGPFVSNNTLYGIVSWGVGCAERGYPGVYTNVSAFSDYIRLNSGL